MDAVTGAIIQRILIILGAIFFGYLGYKLYMNGLKEDRGKLNVESKLMSFVLSGTGPGLFFMAFGGIVLVIALFTGGGERTVVEGRSGASDDRNGLYIPSEDTEKICLDLKSLDIAELTPLGQSTISSHCKVN